MCLIHRVVGKEAFVGRDQRQIQRICHFDQRWFDAPFVVDSMPHHFDIEAARKEASQLRKNSFGSRTLALRQQSADGPRQATRECDDTIGEA